MSSLLNFIAMLVSIVGGAVSVWQAISARSQARRVLAYRNEISAVRGASNFSAIDSALVRAIADMSKYGPAAAESSLVGVDPAKDAAEVQSLITVVRRNKLEFSNGQRELDELCDRLSEDIAKLVDSYPSSPADMKNAGVKVYHRLTEFSAIVRGYLDRLNLPTP